MPPVYLSVAFRQKDPFSFNEFPILSLFACRGKAGEALLYALVRPAHSPLPWNSLAYVIFRFSE